MVNVSKQIILKIFNMSKELVCRTCLTKTSNCASIYYTESILCGVKQVLFKMIMACAPVQIAEGDGYPEHICEDCLKQLQFSFLYRMKILQADSQLKQMTRGQQALELKTEEKENTEDIDKESTQDNEETSELNIEPTPLEQITLIVNPSDISYFQVSDTDTFDDGQIETYQCGTILNGNNLPEPIPVLSNESISNNENSLQLPTVLDNNAIEYQTLNSNTEGENNDVYILPNVTEAVPVTKTPKKIEIIENSTIRNLDSVMASIQEQNRKKTKVKNVKKVKSENNLEQTSPKRPKNCNPIVID